MSDDPDLTSVTPPPRSPWRGVRRFVFSIGVLTIFWAIFGWVVPRLLFPPPPPPIPSVPAPTEPQPSAVPEEAPAAPATEALPPPETLAPNDDRIAKLEAQLASQQAEIVELKSQAATQASGDISRKLSALVLFGQLKEAVLAGRPYDATLAQLKPLTDNQTAQAAMVVLSFHAEQGIAPLAKLQSSFAPLLPGVLAAGQENRFAHTLRSLISVRKIGEPIGTDDESILARAESKLSRDELVEALVELDALSPSGKQALAQWIDSAKAYLEAQSALSSLQLALTQ